MQAEQADDVGAVGVEVLALAGAVEADLGSGPLDAFVADVAEQGAGGVLADRGAEVQAQREVGELGLDVVEQIDREATQEHEPVALGEHPHDLAEDVPHRGQRRVVERQRCDGATVGGCGACDRCDLVALLVGELDRPGRRAREVGGVPDGGRLDRRTLGVGRRHQQQRASASGTDAQQSESPVWSSTFAELWPKSSLSSSTV